MPGTDLRNGAGVTSRTAEFTGGATTAALGGSTGANYLVKQGPPPVMTAYQPSSVLSPVGGSGIGQSANTFQSNRILQYYRT